MSTLAQRMARAVHLHEAGSLPAAEALYREILEDAPQHPHALHLLGVLLHQTARHAEAIDLIVRALAVHGPHPVFYSNLAAVYLEVGRLDETLAACDAALRLQPDLANAHNNRGVALRRLGRFVDAENAFRETLRLDPAHADARSHLGAVLLKQDKLQQALACLQDAVRRAPGHAQTRNDLGGALLAADQPGPAAEHLREALRLRPNFVEAQSNLGLALRDLGQIDEAMHCFREALRLDPGHAAARNNLAYALEVQGRIDEALAEFLEVRRREPDNAMAIACLSGLAVTGHHQFSEMELHRIEALAARSDLPAEDLCRLHFALSRLFDKAGAWDEAFAHCQRSNELRKEIVGRRGMAFDPAEHRRLVDRLIATFTPAYFARVASFGVESDLPVFIVGMMRSGTTLAEQILASHPRVHGAGELQDIPALVGRLHRSAAGREYPESMTDLNAATARALAEEQLSRLRQRGGPAERVVDKMPLNFLNLGVIATLFPRATIVHCRRDPVDTCASCYFQNFADPLPFKCDLGHLGLYYREYERLMAHWARVLPLRIFELHYEELTADPETVSRQLVAACGLAWDDRCLEFNVTERPVRTASVLQVRKPMYRSSVGRWQRYEKHLEPLLEALGRRRSSP